MDSPGTDVAQQAQAGLALRGMVGNLDDLAGIAFSIAIPRYGELHQEKITELFYQCWSGRRTQLSAGAQAIFDPSRAAQSGNRWRVLRPAPYYVLIGRFSLRSSLPLAA